MPETHVQRLAAASGLLGVLSWIAYILHPDAGVAIASMALGVWASALYLWVTDENTLLGF